MKKTSLLFVFYTLLWIIDPVQTKFNQYLPDNVLDQRMCVSVVIGYDFIAHAMS